MRQLVIDHDLPFAAEAVPIMIGLAILVVVLVVMVIVLVWPRSRR